jgi:hypothetical protein
MPYRLMAIVKRARLNESLSGLASASVVLEDQDNATKKTPFLQ